MTERQPTKNKVDAETEICQALIRFEKEFMGRGPLEIRSFIVEDMVLIRLKGVLTPAEIKLAEVEEGPRGRYLLKQVRQELLERGRPLLEVAVRDILGVNVLSVHTDISTRTGERIIVFTLERPPGLGSNRPLNVAAERRKELTA